MKVLLGFLAMLLIFFQYQIWFGENSRHSLSLLDQQMAQQILDNEKLLDRNRELEVEIRDLKTGLEAIEERARTELGMVGQDETFYLIVE